MDVAHAADRKVSRDDRCHDHAAPQAAVPPIVVFTIMEQPYQLQQSDRPEYAAKPVDGQERKRTHEAEVAGAGPQKQPYDQQQRNDKPLHRLPGVAEIGQLGRHPRSATHIA